MSRGCFYIIGIVVAGLLSLLTLNTPQEISPVSPIDLLQLDACNAPPCLFGESLQEANYEQVEKMLEDAPLTQGVTIEHNDITLEWFWPETLGTSLDPISGAPYFYYNYVLFREGKVAWVELVFTVRLDELISRWGEPETITPYTYTHWGEMLTLLNYGESRGYFGVLLSCSEPELTPDELVRFHFSARPGAISKEFEMPWIGYTSDLPTCAIFQP